MNKPSLPKITPITPGLEPEMASPTFLTVQQVARMFGCKPRTVRSWIADKKLPVVRLGGKPFVPAAAIEALIRGISASEDEGDFPQDIK